MDVGSSVVADSESSVAVKPGDGPFNDPSMLAKAGVRRHTTPSDSVLDMTLPATSPTALVIVAFVGVQLVGTLPRTTSSACLYRDDGIEEFFEELGVMGVGRGEEDGERRSVPVDNNVVFGPLFAPVRRVLPRFLAPPGAGTLPESREARDQSILSALVSSWRRTAWSLSQTPCSFQSRSLRQSVIPLHPSSWGKSSQARPVFSTKRIPRSAIRLRTGGRPMLPGGRSGGRSGSTTAHSSSERISRAITPHRTENPLLNTFVRRS